jgi:LytS/YehU family sensor histidine kinase
MNIFDPIEHFHITPLLLLPLIENSFKHGVSNNIDDSWIRIDVSVREEWLSVKIENSFVNGTVKTGNNNGIGLENVKKRLEISYPASHEFRHMPDGHSFLTVLKIKNLPS